MADQGLGRAGLQPLIQIGTGGQAVGAAVQQEGLLRLFGAGVIEGPTPANRFFSHPAPPFPFDWEIIGYSVALLMARGSLAEMNGGLQLQNSLFSSAAGRGKLLLGWASDDHELNAWFEAERIIMLPCPIIVLKDTELYFRWLINNIGVASTFDVQLRVYWKYRQNQGAP